MEAKKKEKRKLNIFRGKLFIIFVVALMLPYMIVSYTLYQDSQEKSKQYTAEEIQNNLAQNAATIEAKLDAVSDAGTSLKFALEQNDAVMIPNTERQDIDIYNQFQKIFSTYTSLIDETYNVGGFSYFYLYYPYRTLLMVSDATFFSNVMSNTLDCYQVEEGKWGIATPYENIICNPTLGIYLCDCDFVQNYQLKDEVGNELFLTACVDERYINRLLSADFQIQPTWLAILDSYGNPVSTKEQRDLSQAKEPYLDIINRISSLEKEGNVDMNIEGKDYVLNWTYSSTHGWYYICVTDTETILEGTEFLSSVNLVVFLFLFLTAIGLAWSVDVAMKRRASKMIASIRDIEQQVTLNKVPDVLEKAKVKKNSDEYDKIYDEFYEMTSRVCNVAKEALQQKDKQTMTTIQMLQTELDPHMLYNSLESAYSIAKLNKQEEIAELIMALSKFFRIALSGGKKFVTFREAFELSKQYIIVQNVRVNNKITFTHSIETSVQELMVPKFLLQPLVENAVVHGFKNKSDEWKIHIEAVRKEDVVQITVTDNGIGMSEMELVKLNEKIKEPIFENSVGNKGYALRNLNYQLKLKYGVRSGVTIWSTYGEGTKAVIQLYGIDEEIKERRESGCTDY